MKKKRIALVLTVLILAAVGISVKTYSDSQKNSISRISVEKNSAMKKTDPNRIEIRMYRLYNPNSGEHFYTKSEKEKNYLAVSGWNYEGTGWYAPSSGNPVYRLYNPNSGDHHYTTSAREKNYLVGAGWNYEGVGWYSGGTYPVYRQYNPNAKTGSHNFTTSLKENESLVRNGWQAEGIAWYAEDVP